MNFRGQSPARRRLWVWAVGSAVALGYYFTQACNVPHRTAVGVEHPICGLENLSAVLKESPSGRDWLLILPQVDASSAGSTPGSPWLLAQSLREFQWPGHATTARRLKPFESVGTWLFEGSSLRHFSNFAANGWLDDEHVMVTDDSDWKPPVAILDLAEGRAVHGEWSEDVERRYSELIDESPGGLEQDEWDPDLWSTLLSGLEALPPDFARGWKYGHNVIGARGVYLVHTFAAGGAPATLYAISDEPAPRLLRLASGARPLALSRDGRTLFFERGGVLWRLDLCKPLPALLDEVSVPDLADPLAGTIAPAAAAEPVRALRGRR